MKDNNEEIILTPNYEITTFRKAELVIKSDNLEIKKVYNDVDYNIFEFLFFSMDLLMKEENVVIKYYKYIKKGNKDYIEVRELNFQALIEYYKELNYG